VKHAVGLIGTSCLVVLATSLVGGSAAIADEAPAITSTLPAVINAVELMRIPFTINAPAGVCAVEAYGHGVRVEGTDPYELVVDPGRWSPGAADATVRVTDCAGNGEFLTTMVTVPFTARWTAVVAPWASDGGQSDMAITVDNGIEAPVAVSVLHNGEAVKEFEPVTELQTLRFPIKKSDASGTWSVRVSNGASTITGPVTVARKWALEGMAGVAFPRCSTVTWSYAAKGAPTRAKGIDADLRKALTQISGLSGIRFQQVQGDAQLSVGWKNLGTHGPSGIGGYDFSSSGGTSTYLGHVDLNTKDAWVGKPGFGRVASWGGTPARGVLLLHEIGHAMGLGHVNAPDQLMNPVAGPHSPTGNSAGERAGYEYIYRPASCS
jgi:hypothetical protein